MSTKHAFDSVYTPDTKLALVSAFEDADRESRIRRKLDFGNAGASSSSSAAGGFEPMSDVPASSRSYNEPFFWETRRKSFKSRRYSRRVPFTKRRIAKYSRSVKTSLSSLISSSYSLIKKLQRKR